MKMATHPQGLFQQQSVGERITVVDLKQKKVGDLLYVQATLENDWKFQLDFP